MIGRRSTNSSDAGGEREQRDEPDAERRAAMNAALSRAGDGAGHLGDERRGDRHRQQPVGEHEERERLEVGRRRRREPGSARLRTTTIATWLATT